MVFSDFTKKDYTSQDFLRLIEHRIRKEIRTQQLLTSKQSYQLREEDSLQSQVLHHFLAQIFQGRLDLSGGDIIDTDFLEQYISQRLDVFLKGKETDTLYEKSLAPLRVVTQHELKELKSILSLQGEIEDVDQEIIERLGKKYPQTKPSFLKSFVHIEKMKKN